MPDSTQAMDADSLAKMLDDLTRQLDREATDGKLPMDPFTGKVARHEGTDFANDIDAPILAAESGVVISGAQSTDYGTVIDIDHGDGLTTRYGHCAKLLVKAGAIVKRDQEIALIGSTGPQVHFEVRKNGVPLNPLIFLSRRD